MSQRSWSNQEDSLERTPSDREARRVRRRQRWRRRLIVYTGVLLVSKIIGCNHLFYLPDSRQYTTPEDAPAPCEEIRFQSADGTNLHGWLLRSEAEVVHGTVIHFHGNAQNLTSHVRIVDWLPAEGFHLFTFDYRGYGKSEGRPSRRGIHQDCLAALATVRDLDGVDADRIFVLGQSLGGACALAAVGESSSPGVRAVVADGTFLWYREIANDAVGGSWLTYPFVWFLISNDHSPGHSISNLSSIPLLVLHGSADKIVGPHHGQAIYDAASESACQMEVLDGVEHLRTFEGLAGRRRVVRFFIEALSGPAIAE